MALIIFWSQFAEDRLRDIYDYYKLKAGIEKASKIVNDIVDKTIDLQDFPRRGALEEFLVDRPQEFRFIISKSFKILYYINFKSQKIVIANIFDTRRNPSRIRETKP